MSSAVMPPAAATKPPERRKKRWSIVKLFRMKKSESSSSTSEEEDGNKKGSGLLGRRKSDRGSKDVTSAFLIEQRRSSSSEEGGGGGSGGRARRTRGARTERYMKRKKERPLSYAFEPPPPPDNSPPMIIHQRILHCTPPRPRPLPRPPPPPQYIRQEHFPRPEPFLRQDPYLSDTQIRMRNGMDIRRRKETEAMIMRRLPPLERAGSASPRLVRFHRDYTHDSASSLSGSEFLKHDPPTPRGSHEKISSLPRKKEEDLRPLSIVVEKSEHEDLETNKKSVPPTPPQRKSSKITSKSGVLDAAERPRQRRSNDLEEALNELEAIYRSLKLGEEEMWEGKKRGGGDSDSGYSCASRVTDDMAYRRLNTRKESKAQDTREMASRAGSYLLVSPTLSPPPLVRLSRPPGIAPLTSSEPDITLDDVVYRSVMQTKNSLRVPDPQPLFGIPLGPISPASDTDYLHVNPPQISPKPSQTPDLITDDLAFRNLRKDSPVTKKKKAVRSLSANLSGFVFGSVFDYPQQKEVNNNYEPIKPVSPRVKPRSHSHVEELKSHSHVDVSKNQVANARYHDFRNVRNHPLIETYNMRKLPHLELHSTRTANYHQEQNGFRKFSECNGLRNRFHNEVYPRIQSQVHTPRKLPEVSNKTRGGLNQVEGLKLAQKMLDNRRKALQASAKKQDSPNPPPSPAPEDRVEESTTSPSKEELRKRFFSEAYKSLEESKESQLLQQLEDEARATSDQIGKELEQLNGRQEADSRSVTDLLKELTKSLDWDYGEPPARGREGCCAEERGCVRWGVDAGVDTKT